MADQAAIVQELFNRIGTLPPDKAAIVQELAQRFNVAPDAGAQMRASTQQKTIESMQADNPYNFTDTSGGGFWDSTKEAFSGALRGMVHLPTAAEISPTLSSGDMKDIPAQTIQRVTDQATSGNFTGALGTVTGTAAVLAGPALVTEGVRQVPRVVRAGVDAAGNAIKLPRSGTPVQQAAVDWALNQGAPMNAGAATLNPLVRGTQEITRSTIGAGANAERATQALNEWYARKGRDLADQVQPGTQTPELAARAVNDQGLAKIRNSAAAERAAYQEYLSHETDPKNFRDVQTGTKPETRHMPTGEVDANGAPVMQSVTREVPVVENLPVPVDLRQIKDDFAPVVADLRRRINYGQSQYAPALMAVEDITNGPDFVKASVAEDNLGALKQVSRQETLTGGVKTKAGALASDTVDALQNAIDSSVESTAGPDALAALRKGRLETWNKYDAIGLVDQFRAEPVKFFQQLTTAKDGGIDLLRKVQQVAPEQMPAIGRAWLDGALDQATESGGFSHADKLFADWQKLGDGTKQVIFKNPALISDLDKFFQSAKDSATVENKSGTAKVAHLSAQGNAIAFGIFHPLAAAGTAAYLIGGNAISRLLYNPRFVRAAIRAMNTPAGSAGAGAAASNLIAAAGAAAVPVSAGTAGTMAPGASPVATSANGANGVSIFSGGAGASGESGAVSGAAGASGGTGANAASAQGGGVGSSDTIVPVPGQAGRSYKAQYRIKELAEINASHSGQTFNPNPKYALKNDRDYANAVNQGKIIGWSSPSEFDPKFHITDNPDALNGPVVTDSEGNVLGGNGRTMIMQRVYSGNPKGAAAYRELLTQKAGQFGVDPAAVSKMKRPVLVREIPDSELPTLAAKQRAVTDFNVKGTAELTPGERAISDSRRVSPETLEHVAAKLEGQGPDSTLADVIKGKGGGDVLNRLVEDGVVSPQERAAFMTSEGELTQAGRDRIAQLMLGRFFRDPAQLDSIAPSIRNKVERMAAPLAQVEDRGEWNLTPDVRTAIDILHKAKSRNLDDFFKQEDLFGQSQYSERAVALAHAIKSMKSQDIVKALRRYAEDSNFAAGGANMFGSTPTPESAFADAFPEVKPPANSLAK